LLVEQQECNWPVKSQNVGMPVLIRLKLGANDFHILRHPRPVSITIHPYHIHHLLLQQNPEWFDILVPAYQGRP